MTDEKKPPLSVVEGAKMYDDVSDEQLQEEWEDSIKSFVPAFAGVKVEEIGDRSLDAHLIIENDGQLSVRLMDANETIKFVFPLKDIFEFDFEQFATEEWELFFGLIETYHQLKAIVGDFEARFAKVEEIMKLRDDKPPVN